MKRRLLLQAILAGSIGLSMAAHAAQPAVEVYKSAYCGCCEEWVKHMRVNGFTVNAHDVANPTDHRARLGMPDQLGSCHTATVQGYVLEGHVPAKEVKRLLAERPKAKGLAVPAMPAGSPGMEGPRKDPYDVLLVKADGSYAVYQHYSGK
jgi:hypothetical protein